MPADDGMCRPSTVSELVAVVLGGLVAGYETGDNPDAILGRDDGGHDFALVDGRWLLDWSPAHCLDEIPAPGCLDLADPIHAALVRRLYGNPACWEVRAPDEDYGDRPRGFTLPDPRA